MIIQHDQKRQLSKDDPEKGIKTDGAMIKAAWQKNEKVMSRNFYR